MALIIHIVCNFVCRCKHFVFVALDNRVEKSAKAWIDKPSNVKEKIKQKLLVVPSLQELFSLSYEGRL